MPRPNGRLDATLERNEHSLSRARDRQRKYVSADRELRAALNDLDDAQERVTDAEAKICELHRIDEKLCRDLHAENVTLSRSAVA